LKLDTKFSAQDARKTHQLGNHQKMLGKLDLRIKDLQKQLKEVPKQLQSKINTAVL
jgi:hypothetical protein